MILRPPMYLSSSARIACSFLPVVLVANISLSGTCFTAIAMSIARVVTDCATKTVSQEAAKIITEFPADRTALSEYDAILAFDADWTKVSDNQVKALEQWVAEQAGGLLMVAGNVEMPKWLSRSSSGERSAVLRSLSPVVLVQSGRSTSGGRIESEKSWP